MQYIDLHCDTLLIRNFKRPSETLAHNTWCVDFQRMRQGKCAAQFFAVFLPTPNYFRKNQLPLPDDWDYAAARINDLKEELTDCRCDIRPAHNAEELLSNLHSDYCSAFLTIEDGRLLAGKLENIDRLYDMGVRLMTLTWNNPNCLGFPHSSDPSKMSLGLTKFGHQAVSAMQEKGIIVDVSHLSDGGFWDALQISKKPIIASHSNARALCNHTRNLSDEMIRALAQSGGGSGLNLAPEMLCAAGGKSRIKDMVRHICHFINVGGEDFPMIGTDFDGMHGDLEISSCSQMPLLFDALEKAGLTQAQIEKVAFKNALRIIHDTL